MLELRLLGVGRNSGVPRLRGTAGRRTIVAGCRLHDDVLLGDPRLRGLKVRGVIRTGGGTLKAGGLELAEFGAYLRTSDRRGRLLSKGQNRNRQNAGGD